MDTTIILDRDVQVGDLLLFEATLYVESALENDDSGHTAWPEFGDTMAASLVPLTTGAVLTSVPLPAGWILLVSVGPMMVLLRRRGD